MSLDAELEVAVYLHNFHNMDLFQQGWYAIKVTCYWESPLSLAGIPSRVVQYEAPDVVSGEANTFWRIDDVENSYTSRFMRIRYARQDFALQEMVSFHLPVIHNASHDASLIIKFELMFAPRDKTATIEQVPEEIESISSHSFQVVSRYWHCLHSYAPVTFDPYHFVQLDVNVHTVLLSFSPKLLLPLSNPENDEKEDTRPASLTSQKNTESEKADFVSKSKESDKLETVSNSDVKNLELKDQRNDEATSDKTASINPSTSSQVNTSALTIEDFRLLRLLESSRKILMKKLLTFFIQLGLESSFSILDSEPDVVEAKLATMVSQIPRANSIRDSEKSSSEDMKFMTIPRGGSISYNILDSSATLNELYKNVYSRMTLDEYMSQRRELTSQVASLWNIFLGFHRLHHSRLCRLLRLSWESLREKEASLFAIEENMTELDDIFGLGGGNWLNNWRNLRTDLLKKSHEERSIFSSNRANLYREGLRQAKFEESPLLDMQIFGDPGSQPILFLERYVSKAELENVEVRIQPSSPPYPDDKSEKAAINSYLKLINLQKRREGKHVVVFVHGFQGNHQDLRLVRNYWLMLDPDIECIMSDINEDRTFDSFGEMGHRLAIEVSGILTNMFGLKSEGKSLPRHKLRHLSFVGFSIGNLIIRSALADELMKPFSKYLYTYVSLSAPHLGYLYSNNSLFNSGLWVLKRLKNDAVMHQLTFTDQSDIKDCYLYQLSQTQSLDHFQHIILLSSPQDGYVPYHSARIELCQAAIKDPKRGPAYSSMVQGCLKGFAESPSTTGRKTLVRVDVNFDATVQAKNVDSMIGRAAHVHFLENDVYIRLWMWALRNCFL